MLDEMYEQKIIIYMYMVLKNECKHYLQQRQYSQQNCERAKCNLHSPISESAIQVTLLYRYVCRYTFLLCDVHMYCCYIYSIPMVGDE